MASRLEFVRYVTDQLSGAGDVVFRRMFGEYGLFRNGVFFAVICDDQLFIKITEAGRKFAPDLEEAPPYEGAKDYFLIDDIDNSDFLVKLAEVTLSHLPPPRKRKKKDGNSNPGKTR